MKAENDPQKLLVNTEAACRLLSISPRSLWGLKQAGEIPHVRIGRSVRYAIDDLITYVDAKRKGGGHDV